MTQKKIDSVLSTEYYHVFYKGKELKQLMQKTIPKLKKAIKENVNSPKTNKKVYIVSLKYKLDSDKKKINYKLFSKYNYSWAKFSNR